MPVYARKIFSAADEFRGEAGQVLGPEWAGMRPQAPQAKLEAKQLLRKRMEAREFRALWRLAALGSVSAGIITRL